MMKKDLIKTIVDKTDISVEKATTVLDQIFLSRAIPSVIKDRIFSNIAEGAEVTVEQTQKAVGAIFGKLTEDPAIFELASNQLVAAWINDCDGCNACGAALVARNPEVQMQTNPLRQK